MKKFIALFLALVMCIGLVACGNSSTPGTEQPSQTPPASPAPTESVTPPSEEVPAPTAGDYLADARAYVRAMYKDKMGKVLRDFDVVASIKIGEFTYDITWTTDASEENVKIGAPADNKVKIDINEKPVGEDLVFTLTATVNADGKSDSTTFDFYVPATKASGTTFVDAPEAGSTYKFALVQAELGETLYFIGEMSGYYLATSTNPAEAIDVTVEAVDGGHRLFFVKDGVKTYIDIVPRGADNPGKVNVVLTDAPTCVFTWDAERKTYTTTVEENNWYLGCYSTYNTMSASNTSYIEDVTKIGISQFPAGLCTVNIVAEQVAAPVADTAYKFAVVQNNLEQTLYFTGEMSGYYLATSANPAEGVNIFVENAEGGVRLYFMKGETKTYIDVVPRGADNPGKVNVVLTEEPTCVFNWDAERKTYVTTVEENNWYLGCYNTYNTMSASNTSYIQDVAKIGDSQFPAGPYIVEGFMDLQPTFEKEPSVEPEPEEPVVSNDPAADSKLSVADALKLGASKAHSTYTEGKYYVTGVISEVYNEQYGNMKITDGAGNVLTVYGTYNADGTVRYDGLETKPVAGDTVTVYGIIGQYNDTPQMKNGWITEHTPAAGTTEPDPEPTPEPDPEPTPEPEPSTDPAADSKLSVADAVKLGASKEHNTYTEGKYYVTGVITEVYNTQYGNMKIADEAGNILTVYGTYNGDGSIRYDGLETKPVAGDTVTVYGIIGQYNGTAQIKNGWITEHTPAVTTEPTPDPEPSEEPSTGLATSAEDMATVDEAYALAAGKALSGKRTLTGVVVNINSLYDASYNNISVDIRIPGKEGQPILCYRMKGDGIDKLAIGDVITVTGTLKNYNGTIEFDTGCTLDKVVSTGAAIEVCTDAEKILAEGAALASGEHLPYNATLTGTITKITNKYDAKYRNITVIISVNGVEIQCYRMLGEGLENLAVGDTITVSGIIENYKGNVNFAQGCALQK